MALLNVAIQVSKQISNLFQVIREGQAPAKFNREFLKDIGFKSSNHMAFIPLLKGLGFLTSDGVPTSRYKDFLDETKWKTVLAEAVKEAYSDLFTIKSQPTRADFKAIAGKFKSSLNMSEITSNRAASTFLALVEISDKDTLYKKEDTKQTNKQENNGETSNDTPQAAPEKSTPSSKVKLNYNIQIHLPATKDLEVYNAIFKSLRNHIID